jgi:hypothetical protein
MNDLIKKVLIALVVLVVLIPILPKILPKAPSFDRAKKAFEAAQFVVSDYSEHSNPGLDAVAGAFMNVGTARVELYRYDSEGKIALQLGYQQPDPGQAMVESWGLAESLGAAPNPNMPQSAVRNGKYMLVVHDYDEVLRQVIVGLFKKL